MNNYILGNSLSNYARLFPFLFTRSVPAAINTREELLNWNPMFCFAILQPAKWKVRLIKRQDFDRKRGTWRDRRIRGKFHGRIENFDNGTQPVNLSIVAIQLRNAAINSEASRNYICEILIQRSTEKSILKQLRKWNKLFKSDTEIITERKMSIPCNDYSI